VLEHIGQNFGSGDRRGPDAQLAVTIDEEHTIKRDGLPRLDFEVLNFQFVAGCDPVLFAACL
jgi:hypothetical protein